MKDLTAALEGRYTIERELGAGGMATVYLARDVKHDRHVALKVLRPELAAVLGAERFLKEIRLTANLQHPHILPLHDSGEAAGRVFYVMPYVDGETLRDKLNREKQLPVDDAVRIAREVLSALDYAHRRGVIHRDIKPENILLHEGQALVADFGIALAVSTAGANTRMTETGMSLGTPHYMSPEQAMGEREITARSDVYALGCVLYEMLLGEPPFSGPTAQAIIARVITEEPRSLTMQRKTIPPNVDTAVRMALQKLPADRFATAAEFAQALANPSYATNAFTSAHTGGQVAIPSPWRQPAIRALIGVAAAAIAIAAWGWMRPVAHEPVSRFSIALPDSQAMQDGLGTRIALSPDGSYFVYVGPGEGGGRLWVRERGKLSARPIPGTEGAINPFFSPDGQRIAFFTVAPMKLKTVSLGGDVPMVLADSVVDWDGGSWARDGFIYTDAIAPRGLMRMPEHGGALEVVTRIDTTRDEIEHSYPEVLPNGKGAIYVTWGRGGPTSYRIAAVNLRTHVQTQLIDAMYARYIAPGFLLYVTAAGTLLAAPFDQDRLVLTGPGVAVGDGVSLRSNSANDGYVDVALSPSGTLLYVAGQAETARSELAWVDRTGSVQVIDTGAFTMPAISFDGKRAAVSGSQRADRQIWVKPLSGGPLSKVTFEGGITMRPAWTSDGSLSYLSIRKRDYDVYTQPGDGSGTPKLVLDRDTSVNEVTWSRDGHWMVYRQANVPAADIFARRLSGDTTPIAIAASKFSEEAPALSDDSHWIAYTSDESGRDEIYVRPFPDAGRAKFQVSAAGGTEPLWAHSGREIFYRNAKGEMVAVDVISTAPFSVGASHVLFSASEFAIDGAHREYDISPDDKRFLMTRPRRSTVHTELIIVDHFLDELRAKMKR